MDQNQTKKLTPLQRLIQQRRSIRRFLDKPVDRDSITMCIEAARVAPSADNVQPWRFLIIDDQEIKENLAKEVFSGIYSISKFAAQAPVIVVVLAKLDIIANRIGKQIQDIHFYLLDVGMAGEHFVLQAEELGLGTCWIGWFNIRRARKILDIPRKYKIVSLLALGHYEKRPRRERKIKPLGKIAWFNEIKD
jgi:nitroreductase